MERDRAMYDFDRRGRSRSPEDGMSRVDCLIVCELTVPT